MRLVFDSNEFIFGLDEESGQSASIELLNRFRGLIDETDDVILIVPKIIRKETHKNLPEELRDEFYQYIFSTDRISVLWQDSVPEALYEKYRHVLKEEDALIAAIAEAEQVDCIISDNRHFYERLQVDIFLTLTAEAFLHALETGEIWQMIKKVRQNRTQKGP